jgi:hypothetical protein
MSRAPWRVQKKTVKGKGPLIGAQVRPRLELSTLLSENSESLCQDSDRCTKSRQVIGNFNPRRDI